MMTTPAGRGTGRRFPSGARRIAVRHWSDARRAGPVALAGVSTSMGIAALRCRSVALLAVVLSGCGSAPLAGAERQASAGLVPFVDSHVHLNDEGLQLELMRRYGATQAVIFWGRNSDNASIADAARRHPDLFIAFASISPERASYRTAWDRDDASVLRSLEELLASGRFKGIGEISAVHFPSPGLAETDYDPTGPTMRGIMALARRHRVPVMVHIEVTRLRELGALLEGHRDVPVIWAHGGYTPLFIARRMLARHPNLSYELSARTWPRHPRSPDYTILRDGGAVWPEWLELIEAMSERFVIGTDASQRSRESEIMKLESVQAFLRQLSPAARDRVARTNLLRLLGAGR
jgi:predicted TIM-barrel fold metal-dependent hydrolase